MHHFQVTDFTHHISKAIGQSCNGQRSLILGASVEQRHDMGEDDRGFSRKDRISNDTGGFYGVRGKNLR